MKNNYYDIQKRNNRRTKRSAKNSRLHSSRNSKNSTSYSSRSEFSNSSRNNSNVKYSVSNGRKMTPEQRMQSNYRKRQAKKINKKKLFTAILILLLIIYLICFGFGKIISKIRKPKQTTQAVTSVPKDITINMSVVGDIMCHSTNFKDAYNSDTETYDFSYVFEQVEKYLVNADLTVGNLETTFAGSEIGYSGYPTFNTPEQLAQDLVELGFDVVSTANNHSLDKRYAGLESTLNELDKVGLAHTGTYRSKEEQDTIITKNINGINFAFLSFTYGTNGIPVPEGKEYCINLIDNDLILDQISKAKATNPDILCVFMHWGDEYKLKQNKTQEELANFLFENGVDIILGSHPHVLEPMEKRTIKLADGTTKDGFLIYSLGNFVSGQVIEDTKNSIILQLQITKHADNKITIDSYNYIPTYLYDKGEGQKSRYKVLDLNKTITDYDNGNAVVSEKIYNALVSSKAKFDKVLAGN